MFEPEIARLLEDLEASLERSFESVSQVTRIEQRPTQPLLDQPPESMDAYSRPYSRIEHPGKLSFTDLGNHPQSPVSGAFLLPKQMQDIFPFQSPLSSHAHTQAIPTGQYHNHQTARVESNDIAMTLASPYFSSTSSEASAQLEQPSQSSQPTATVPQSTLLISTAGYIRDRWWTPEILNMKGMSNRSVSNTKPPWLSISNVNEDKEREPIQCLLFVML